jgi:transposase InsO family protein
MGSITNVDAGAIASALSIAKRSVERRALKESWSFTEQAVRGGRRRLYALNTLPADVQAAVLLASKATQTAIEKPTKAARDEGQVRALWQRFEAVPQHLKDIAKRRLKALQAVDALVNAGHGLMDARGLVAAQLQREGFRGGSVPSLGRWAADCDGLHRSDWMAALVPGFTGRTARNEIPTEAWDTFKADYLRLEQPSATSCYDRLRRVAKAKGWELPSLRTFERAIERLPRAVRVLTREGEEALMRTFPAQERDRSCFHALEAVNADGHKFDVFVRTHTDQVVRPILVGVQDLYSGKIVGYRMAETESADLARLAFRDVVERYGIPQHAWLDNGRGFASKMLTGGVANRFRFKVRDDDPIGVLVGLGVEIHWATPYHGQAKPIERAWRDLCDRVAKHPAFAGAYTGNKPDAKPENYASHAVPWDTFVEVLHEEIAAHNAREKRRTRLCNGIHSFDQAFAQSYAQAPIRKATPEQLRQMLLAAEVVTANQQDGSVKLAGNRYWTEALAPHAGKKLMIRFDPDALHESVQVYTLANVYLGQADCIVAVGFADTQAAREHARARKQYRRGAKLQRDAELRMDVAKVAAQLPSEAPTELPPPGVVAPVFGKPRYSPNAARSEPQQLQRTGTDNAPAEFGDYLKQMQDRQLAERGWQPVDSDD